MQVQEWDKLYSDLRSWVPGFGEGTPLVTTPPATTGLPTAPATPAMGAFVDTGLDEYRSGFDSNMESDSVSATTVVDISVEEHQPNRF